MSITYKLAEQIVKGVVADYAVKVASNNNVKLQHLAILLREIADELDASR